MATDGSLLMADDSNGVIYRIGYEGGGHPEEAKAQQAAPAAGSATAIVPAAGPNSAAKDAPHALAARIVQSSNWTIEVTSPAFENGQPIPPVYAAEQQNIPPPVVWSAGPEGTRSYVLVLEDPDVAQDPPFVHWTIYNIPSGRTSLREGIPGQPRLLVPEGANQGENDRGSTGYFGMRPPKGDPAHHYHVQVFALDRVLDLPHGATRDQLLAAMRDHILAKGELVGTFERS